MSVDTFVDSNILIYAHDLDAGEKRECAVTRATNIAEFAQLSFWDALIVASAEEVGAEEILSEDLNDRQVIAGIRIINPFKRP